jgi:hypothetical protein
VNTSKRVITSSTAVLASRVGDGVLALVTSIILARHLGPSELGVYSMVFAYIGFYGLLIDLGIRDIVTREASRDRTRMDTLVGGAMALRFVTSLIVILLANGVMLMLPASPQVRVFVALASLSFVFSFSAIYAWSIKLALRSPRPCSSVLHSWRLQSPAARRVILSVRRSPSLESACCLYGPSRDVSPAKPGALTYRYGWDCCATPGRY